MRRHIMIVQRRLQAMDTIENLAFEVPRADFDIEGAIKAALAEYAATEEGKENLKDAGGYFDLTDLDNFVPEHIMAKHSFLYVGADIDVGCVEVDDVLFKPDAEEEA